MASREEAAEAIIQYVRAKDWVSFVEVRNIARNVGFSADGNTAMCIDKEEHLVVALGLSLELFDLMSELIREKKIFLHPCDPLIYYVDGSVPNLPIAKHKHAKRKTDAWVPCALRIVPAKKAGWAA